MANLDRMSAFEISDDELEAAVGGVGQPRRGRILGKAFPRSGKQWYRIGTGDTLKEVALYFNTTEDAIRQLNSDKLRSTTLLFPGTEIQIP